MLEVRNQVLNGVLIIHLIGRLDGLTSKTFLEKNSAPEHAAHTRIELNCEGLDYISSEGLRVILITAKKVKSLGGALTLCDMNPSVNEVMVISGFGELLGVHANVDQAIKAIS